MHEDFLFHPQSNLRHVPSWSLLSQVMDFKVCDQRDTATPVCTSTACRITAPMVTSSAFNYLPTIGLCLPDSELLEDRGNSSPQGTNKAWWLGGSALGWVPAPCFLAVWSLSNVASLYLSSIICEVEIIFVPTLWLLRIPSGSEAVRLFVCLQKTWPLSPQIPAMSQSNLCPHPLVSTVLSFLYRSLVA